MSDSRANPPPANVWWRFLDSFKRQLWVKVHRWTGLAMAVFLVVTGLTGSLLAFLPELNHAFSPQLFRDNSATRIPMGLGELVARAEALAPQGKVHSVFVDEPSGTALIWFDQQNDPVTGKPYELGFNQLLMDSSTGKELGRRTVGGLPTGLDNLMPFIYRLHYALSLGSIGGWIMGIAALIWAVDCLVSFYLTLPARLKSSTPAGNERKSWWQRWAVSWKVKWRGSAFRINFDLHRASGLWLCPVLFIFAWSSVGFNLNDEIYTPVMGQFFDMPSDDHPIPHESPFVPMGWQQAQLVADRLAHEQGKLENFSVIRPVAFYLEKEQGYFYYRFKSSLDIQDKGGDTWLTFDLVTGTFKYLHLPASRHAGHTIGTWLFALHMANVFGMPYRIFVCALGLVITMLSVTGVYIWWKKRKARRISKEKHALFEEADNA